MNRGACRHPTPCHPAASCDHRVEAYARDQLIQHERETAAEKLEAFDSGTRHGLGMGIAAGLILSWAVRGVILALITVLR